MMNRKIIIGGSLIVVATTTFILLKVRNNKQFEALWNKISNNKGLGDYRDYEDYFSGNAFIKAMRKKTSSPMILLKDEYVTNYRKQLREALKGLGTDEDKIKEVFNRINSGIQLAQVAESYYSHYKRSLFADLLDDISPDSKTGKDLYRILSNKPKYNTV